MMQLMCHQEIWIDCKSNKFIIALSIFRRNENFREKFICIFYLDIIILF